MISPPRHEYRAMFREGELLFGWVLLRVLGLRVHVSRQNEFVEKYEQNMKRHDIIRTFDDTEQGYMPGEYIVSVVVASAGCRTTGQTMGRRVGFLYSSGALI